MASNGTTDAMLPANHDLQVQVPERQPLGDMILTPALLQAYAATMEASTIEQGKDLAMAIRRKLETLTDDGDFVLGQSYEDREFGQIVAFCIRTVENDQCTSDAFYEHLASGNSRADEAPADDSHGKPLVLTASNIH
jgi:hypothetical protein